jgi:chitosanase
VQVHLHYKTSLCLRTARPSGSGSRFRGLQDELVDELYFFPAMTMAGKVGIVTPLGQTIMWDTMIQHGAGGDNGTRAIIKETQRNKGTIGQD